jgi:hypothetical protein
MPGHPLDTASGLWKDTSVRKTFVYRLYPTRRQRTLLRHTLEECRWLYNHLLEKRKTTYEQTGQGLTRYQQQATLPALKQGTFWLWGCHPPGSLLPRSPGLQAWRGVTHSAPQGKIPAFRVGDLWKFLRSAIQADIDAQRKQTKGEKPEEGEK